MQRRRMWGRCNVSVDATWHLHAVDPVDMVDGRHSLCLHIGCGSRRMPFVTLLGLVSTRAAPKAHTVGQIPALGRGLRVLEQRGSH